MIFQTERARQAQTSLRHLGTSAADWCLLLKTTLEEAAQIAEQGGEGEKECLDMIALIVAREPAFARALNQAGSPEAVAEALVAAHAVVFCAAHGEEPLQHEEAAGAMLAQPSGAPWLRFVLEGGMLAFADETFAYELETLGAFDQSQGGTGPKHVVVAGSLASLAMHTDDSGVEHRARTLTEVVADLRGGAEFARPTSYLRFGNEARALLRDSAKNREHERVMREALRVTVPFAHWDHDTVTALLECTVLRRVNAQTVIVDAQSRRARPARARVFLSFFFFFFLPSLARVVREEEEARPLYETVCLSLSHSLAGRTRCSCSPRAKCT